MPLFSLYPLFHAHSVIIFYYSPDISLVSMHICGCVSECVFVCVCVCVEDTGRAHILS